MFEDKSLSSHMVQLILPEHAYLEWDHLDSGIEKYTGEKEIRRMLRHRCDYNNDFIFSDKYMHGGAGGFRNYSGS